jgi:hypothetical protein
VYRSVIGLALILAPQPAAPGFPYQDLAAELVEKIAAAVPSPQRVYLVAVGEDADETRRRWERHIAAMLAARGVQMSDRAEGAVNVAFTCSQNVRERVCAADVRRGDGSQLAIAARPHDAVQSAQRSAPLALDVRTLFTHRTPILDVALSGDRLFVLEPAALMLYQRRENGWQPDRSRPIASSRVLPRDIRGRLRLDGATIEALLPGIVCRANVDALNLTCADEQPPWPLGVENTGIAIARNYFTTPEGLAFFGAASLAADADARWLVTAPDGRLLFLDGARRTLDSAAGTGDDVAAVTAACAPGSYVLLSSRASASPVIGGAEALQLFQVIGRRLVPAASPVVMPGPLTALWAAAGASTVTAISRDTNSGQYAAFQIAIICGR